MLVYTLAAIDRLGDLSAKLQCVSFLRETLFQYCITENSPFFGTGVEQSADFFLHDLEVEYVNELHLVLTDNGSFETCKDADTAKKA